MAWLKVGGRTGPADSTRHQDREAVFPQRAVQLSNMRMVARLNGADGVHRGNIRPAKRAIMFDILDARSAARHDARQLGQATRAITDHRGESRQASVVNQAFFDDAA